jgi:hypothetical protein
LWCVAIRGEERELKRERSGSGELVGIACAARRLKRAAVLSRMEAEVEAIGWRVRWERG